MLTIPPAGRRVRARRVAPLVLTAVALASLLAGCGSAKAPQAGSAPAGGSTASGNHTQPPGAAGASRRLRPPPPR